MADLYDEINYPSLPRIQSHPAFIAALARIAGVETPPVERWRVLELGCSDASNIIPLAIDYREGQFVGVDRAPKTLDKGRALARQLNLENLELHEADLLHWQPEGEFDYIIAHGVYSWVPDEIREKMLQICESSLKPSGIAYISYNVLPGFYFRHFTRDLLRFHSRNKPDPAGRIEAARTIAKLFHDAPGEELPRTAIRKEMDAILEKKSATIYHDDLADINEPFYLLDFAARAERHGLQYLGDADPQRDNLQGESGLSDDWLESRQYGDFLAARRFRETLLCRKNLQLDRSLRLDRFMDLYAASRVKPLDINEDGHQKFSFPNSGTLTTNHPYTKNLLCSLSECWPRSMRVSEFPAGNYPSDSIANVLMQLLQAEAIELRSSPPKIAGSIGERPAASALAKAQIAGGGRIVTNQRHQIIEFTDTTGSELLLLLDGNRNHRDLAKEMIKKGIEQTGIDRALEAGLLELYRLSLITG